MWMLFTSCTNIYSSLIRFLQSLNRRSDLIKRRNRKISMLLGCYNLKWRAGSRTKNAAYSLQTIANDWQRGTALCTNEELVELLNSCCSSFVRRSALLAKLRWWHDKAVYMFPVFLESDLGQRTGLYPEHYLLTEAPVCCLLKWYDLLLCSSDH